MALRVTAQMKLLLRRALNHGTADVPRRFFESAPAPPRAEPAREDTTARRVTGDPH